jgi:hypothetical protein
MSSLDLLDRARYASASINFLLSLERLSVLDIYYFYILSNNILVIILFTSISTLLPLSRGEWEGKWQKS